MTSDSGWIGSLGEFAKVQSGRCGLTVATRCEYSPGERIQCTVGLVNDEQQEFTNATVRAMRQIDPDYCPEGFYIKREAKPVRPDVQPVPSGDPPRKADGQHDRPAPGGGRDPVNPEHYKIPGCGVELWDVIEALELDEDAALTQAFQYIARAKHKGSFADDIGKAIWYLARRLGCDVEMKERVTQ